MNVLVPQHQSRQTLITWLNSLGLGKPIDSFGDLMSGDSLCRLMHHIYPTELRLNQITPDAQLSYDRRKNFKLLHKICYRHEIAKSIDIESIVECNNVVQLVELVKQIYTFYMDNFFILQQNNEAVRLKQKAHEERKQVIATLTNERNMYYTKLRLIDDEITKCIRHNQLKMKPHERHEKLVIDSITSILSEKTK